MSDDIANTVSFKQAAAEAREASRRYWAKGGFADRRFPQQETPFWPQAPGGIDDELADRRRRRRQKGGFA